MQLVPDCRILLARLDSLGDCVLSSSFVAGLRNLFPDAHLTGGFADSTAPLYEHCPLFDSIISVPGSPNEGWRRLLGAPYDVAICPRWDVDYWSTRHLAMLSQAPIRIGFDRGAYRYDESNDGWAGAYFTHLIRTRSDRHEVLKGQDMLQSLGSVGAIPNPQIWPSQQSTNWAADFAETHALNRFGVLAVSAGSRHRIWPVENFVPVIDAIRKATSLRFVILGADDAVEAAEWLRRMRPDAVTCATGSVPILSSAALLARSDIYIGMDTGLMHMAAASRVPVVEISCHPVGGDPSHRNSPSRFGPYATRKRVLQPVAPLSPCVEGCSILHAPHCITQIKPLSVIDAAMELLGGSI